MSVWRSAFLHEFPSGNPRNYMAPPGTLSFVEFTVSPNVQPQGFLINPSRWLRYDFNDRYDDVIGVDVTMRGVATIPVLLIFPPVPSEYFPIATIGNGMFKLSIAVEGEQDVARVRVEVGGQPVSFEGLAIPDSFGQVPFTLRVRWHTTGQVHVWWNDQLVAYHPSHAVDASFSIGDVAIGSPHSTSGTFIPFMDVSHFYVKVLRETEAETKLAKELDIDFGYMNPDDPCWERIAKIQDAVTAQFRDFMSQVVAELTQEWRNTDSGQPFSPDAVAAHEAAVAAFKAFITFVRTGDDDSRDGYLANIEKFLSIVARTKPDAFKALLDSIDQNNTSFSAECVANAQHVYNNNLDVLAPIRKLMDETKTIAVNIAGAL